MCYACKNCGKCGKFNPDSPYYRKPGAIPCFKCGGEVDPATGKCKQCGDQALAPVGGGLPGGPGGGGPKLHTRH